MLIGDLKMIQLVSSLHSISHTLAHWDAFWGIPGVRRGGGWFGEDLY